ncbi:nitroreductase family protein [Mesorhizobium huakuii]|uniref:SagB/ThcOx family dehydrogenase n=1 Tax=Mesorhizobium huakuii TaxID=28104 RepID=A0A7G6T4X0_9HYPH|nr:nitroreductase family protein [Mesorhizobium huakuii]QND61802.1 SagB/ThcOx family dehydrogenase [Mesorhizobium huakuii]QND69040.1 SagB/ThcOx family dehydrogenase [Mesorhizobium loti]
MPTNDISALNQIGFTSQFVDPDVEHTVRTFHHHCFTCAGSTLEQRISAPFLSKETLLLAETKESRFSHFSHIVTGHSTSTQTAVSRWPSLKEGQLGIVEFEKIASILGQAIGADGLGRRPYPSGGALYSAEAIVVTSEMVEGIPPFSVAHYLPGSNRFELLPAQFDQDRYNAIATINGAVFYVAYFINLKKATFKYRSRGYRLALLEIGSMYHHITTVAQENGIASRVLAGFSEYEFTKTCGLDSRLLLPAAIQAFGFPGDANVQ